MLKSLQEESFRTVMLATDLTEGISENADKKSAFLRAVTTASRLVHKIDCSSIASNINTITCFLDASTYYTEALIWLNFFVSEGLIPPERARELTLSCNSMLKSIKEITEQIRKDTQGTFF